MPKGIFPRSEKHKAAISAALKGRQTTPEHAANISISKKGRRWSPEQVERHRQWMLANSPNRGKKQSEETKEKLRQANVGKAHKLKKYGITDADYAAQIAAGNRWCHFRKHFTPADQFYKNNGVCRGCNADSQRKSGLAKNYNLTHEDYEKMLAAQGGGCAICGTTKTGRRTKHMMIDHDHATGSIRGILCMPCNLAISRIEAVPNWGMLATQYILKVRS